MGSGTSLDLSVIVPNPTNGEGLLPPHLSKLVPRGVKVRARHIDSKVLFSYYQSSLCKPGFFLPSIIFTTEYFG